MIRRVFFRQQQRDKGLKVIEDNYSVKTQLGIEVFGICIHYGEDVAVVSKR